METDSTMGENKTTPFVVFIHCLSYQHQKCTFFLNCYGILAIVIVGEQTGGGGGVEGAYFFYTFDIQYLLSFIFKNGKK